MGEAGELPVSGSVVFPPGSEPTEAARLVVRVEDVSRADVASTTVGELVLEDVQVPADGGSLPFRMSIPAAALRPRSRYAVRVHVDVSGTGTVTPGDYVSTRSHPLRPGQQDTSVEVRRI